MKTKLTSLAAAALTTTFLLAHTGAATAAPGPVETATLHLPAGDVTGVDKHPRAKTIDLRKVTAYRKGTNIVAVLKVRNVLPHQTNTNNVTEDMQSFCVAIHNTKSTVQTFCGTNETTPLQMNSTYQDGTNWDGTCVHGGASWRFKASTSAETVTFKVPVSCFTKRGAWSVGPHSAFYAGTSGAPTNNDRAGGKFTAKFSDTAAH